MAAVDHADVLVVGGGKAASQLAASLRDDGFDGSVLIVGEEPIEPYDRPPLSKQFLGAGTAVGDLLLRASEFYLASDIAVETGTTIEAIDPSGRRARRADSSWITYGELVLATGARVRRPPLPGIGLCGVTGLRTFEDAQRIRVALAQGERVVVIGGGFVGLEVAASAAAAHACRVTVIEALPQLLSRTALPETASGVLDYHRGLGVEVLLETHVAELRGEDGRVTAVVTTRGTTIPADLVVYGVGVEPRAELAVEAGLEVGSGIVVDEALRTSDPHIWAIGDCSVFPSEHFGGLVRLESVQNATDQARHLARELSSRERSPYRSTPWFWSDQAELKFQSVGLLGARNATQVVGDPATGSFSVLAFRSGELIGGDSVNAAGDHLALRRLLVSGTRVLESELKVALDESGFSLGRFARTMLPRGRVGVADV